MNPRVEQVIICEEKVGHGIEESPTRGVTRIYTLDGTFIAECDSWRDEMLINQGFTEDKDYAKRTTH